MSWWWAAVKVLDDFIMVSAHSDPPPPPAPQRGSGSITILAHAGVRVDMCVCYGSVMPRKFVHIGFSIHSTLLPMLRIKTHGMVLKPTGWSIVPPPPPPHTHTPPPSPLHTHLPSRPPTPTYTHPSIHPANSKICRHAHNAAQHGHSPTTTARSSGTTLPTTLRTRDSTPRGCAGRATAASSCSSSVQLGGSSARPRGSLPTRWGGDGHGSRWLVTQGVGGRSTITGRTSRSSWRPRRREVWFSSAIIGGLNATGGID